jgi:hypothetical protein
MLALVATCVYVVYRTTSKEDGSVSRAAAAAVDSGSNRARFGETALPAGETSTRRADGMKARRLEDRAARAALFKAIAEARRRRLDGFRRDGRESAGELDKEYIRGAVSEVIPQIHDCYETVLKETPKLEGKLNMSFSILGEPDVAGMIDEIAVEGSSDEAMRNSAPLTKCVIDTLSSLEFPAPENGGVVEVEYPFLFEIDDE